MAEAHVISALIDKRARILGEIKAVQFKAMRLRMELAHVDSVIKMFKPDHDIEAIKPKVTLGKSPAALPKGAGTRGALDVLRETGEALSSTELAIAVLIRTGKEADEQSVSMLAKTIHSSFSRQKHPVVTYDRGSWPGKWRLLP
jgi:hypothetical protein